MSFVAINVLCCPNVALISVKSSEHATEQSLIEGAEQLISNAASTASGVVVDR
jgi:hypothetical protein